MKEYGTIITNLGDELINQHVLAGNQAFIADGWSIAIGTGDIMLDKSLTALVNPIFDKNSEGYSGITFGTDETYGRYAQILVPQSLEGNIITEIGLFDENDNLIVAGKTKIDLTQTLENGVLNTFKARLSLLNVPNDILILYTPQGDLVSQENLENYQKLSEKAQAGGYAPLDKNAKVPQTHLPEIDVSTAIELRNVIKSCNVDANGNANILYIEGNDTIIDYHNIVENNVSYGNIDIFGNTSGAGIADNYNTTYTFPEPVETVSGYSSTISFYCFRNNTKAPRISLYVNYSDNTSTTIAHAKVYGEGNHSVVFDTQGKFIKSIDVAWGYAYSDQGNVGIGQIQISAPYYKSVLSAQGINFYVSKQAPLICTFPNGDTKIFNRISYLDVSEMDNGSYTAFVDKGGNIVAKKDYYVQKTVPVSLENVNVSNSANAIYYTSSSTYPITNAYDNNTTTQFDLWNNNSSIIGACYIGQKNLTNPVTRVRFYQGYYNGSHNLSVSSVKFQYSNDNINWIDIQTTNNLLGRSWNDIFIQNYTPTGETHSFRMLANSESEGRVDYSWVVNSFQLYTGINIKQNSAWLDTSTYPCQLKILADSSWVDFDAVHIGNFTVKNGLVTKVATAPVMSALDGEWIDASQTISNTTTIGDYTIDLSTIIPQDSYNYLCRFSCQVESSAHSLIAMHDENGSTWGALRTSTIANPVWYCPVYGNRTVSFLIQRQQATKVQLSIEGYKRIGWMK